MKSKYLFVLLFGVCSLKLAQAEEPTRFHLDLNRPPPRAGDESEITIHFFSTSSNTNLTQGHEEITNSSDFFDMQGREKILNWDVSNDWSKVEITLDHLVDGHDNHTNELASPGTQITGRSILGESFFQTKGGDFSEEAYEQLKKSYSIRPHDFNEFARTKLPQSVIVGQSWEIPSPTNFPEVEGILGASFTNDVKATGQFVGTTNLFGFNCFHLQLHLAYAGMPEFVRKIVAAGPPTKMNIQLALTVDLIAPFDTSQRILMKSYSVNISSPGEMMIDGKKIKCSGGQSTTKIVSEFRPLPHQ